MGLNMEYEKIKELIKDMGNSKLTSLEIDFPDGTKISMKKDEKQIFTDTLSKSDNNITDKNAITENVVTIESKEEETNIIKSPMVGTFYSKPSPDSEPYVEVGKEVRKGDVVCIIEAMKLMNEIESEFNGEIAEILVKDGEPVEYGKPLFRVK